jgi:hypothetical protein
MVVLALVALSGVMACGDDDATDVTDTADVDMGPVVETDAGPVETISCQDRVPTEGFGATPGRNMEPWEFPLQQCDGTEYTFYNEAFCEAEVTVINIAAGWCGPCILESDQLEEEINAVYGPMGVRVIQILIQTNDRAAPDLAYCEDWVDRFGLSNTQLIDPAQLTGIFFPDNALPSTLIIDNQGVIRFRENGASDGLTSLKFAIDEVLGD